MPDDNGFVAPRGVQQNRKPDEIVARMLAERTDQATRTLDLVAPVDPEAHATAAKIAERSGVSVSAAAGAAKADPRSARAFAERHAELIAANPSLARWLSDPTHAAVGQDDVPALANVAEAAAAPTKVGNFWNALKIGGPQTFAAAIHTAVAEGMLSPEAGARMVAGASAVSGAAMENRPAAQRAFQQAFDAEGPGAQAASEQAVEGLSDAARKAWDSFIEHSARGVAQAIGYPERQDKPVADVPFVEPAFGVIRVVDELADLGAAAAENPEGALYFTAENLPNSVVALLSGKVGQVLGRRTGLGAGLFLGGAVVEEGSWIAQEMAAAGIDSSDEAAVLGFYRDVAKMGQARSGGRKKALGTAGSDALLSLFGLGTVGEVVAEGATEGIGQFAATGKVDVPEMMMEVLAGAPQAVGTAAMQSGEEAAPERPSAVTENRQRVLAQRALQEVLGGLQAEQEVKQATATGEAMAASKTATRLPEAVRELVAAAGPNPAPTVAVEAWDAFQAAAGKSPAAEAERLGGDYAAAKATGTLTLPYARVAEEAPGPLAGLLPDVRFRADLPTLREAQEAAPAIQEAMQKAATEAEAAAAGQPSPEQEAADEARAAELEAELGVPEGATTLYQSAAPEPAPEGEAGKPGEAKPAPATSPLRATADAIEAAAPGIAGRVLNAVTGREPVAEAVRGSLAGPTAEAGLLRATTEGGTVGPKPSAGSAPSIIEPLAAAAQRDPAGTAAALRELADIRDRQAAAEGPTLTVRRQIEAALRAAGRPAGEAKAGAALLSSFVRTMEARYPEVARDLWSRFAIKFARGAAPTEARQQGKRGAYDPVTRTIYFMEAADASTAIHEFAHAALDIMGALAADPSAPESLRADFAALREQVGNKGEPFTREQHEEFAKAFEAYVLTGEAPSVGLRRVFATLAAWMRKLYADVKVLINADKLSPELRGIFDRMLATEHEIAAAEAETSLTPLFPTEAEMKAAGVEPETAAKYQAKVRDARDTAIERITRKVTAALAREKKAERDALLDTYRADLAARVDTLPGPVALANMRDGKGDVLVKLDADAVAEALPGAAKRLVKLGVTAKEGGVTPQAAADLFGFDSPDALADALILASNRDKLVDALARQRLAAERPDLVMDRPAIAAEARKQVVATGREEVLSEELRILGRLLVPTEREGAAERRAKTAETAAAAGDAAVGVADDLRRAAIASVPSLAVVREAARQTLASKRLRDIRPSTYLMAVQREGRAAARHVAAGAFDLAAKAKSAQAMSLALYREAIRLTEQAEKNRHYLKRIATTGQDVLGRAGFTYKDQVNAILARHDLGRISGVEAERREALAAWIKYVEEETGRQPDIAPSVLREAERTNWRDLTAARLADVRDSVQSIYEIARTKDKLLKAKKDREIGAAARDILDTAAKHNDPLPAARRLSETEAEKKAGRWAAFRGALMKVPQIARNLDGNIDGGAAWEYLVRPINAAAAERRSRELAVAKERARLNNLFTPDERRDMQVKRTVRGVAESVSHADRLMVLLNMGNEGNLSRLVGMEINGVRVGGTLQPAEVEAIVAQATPADIAWVRGIWAIYEGLRPDVFAMHERVTGVRPAAVAARPFTVNGVTLEGGYFPIVYGGLRGEEMSAETAARQVGQAVTARSMTAHGHTEARQQFVRHPLLLDMGVIDRTLSQVILDLTHREALIDAQRVLRHDDTKAALMTYSGKAAYDQFRALYGDIAADDRRFAERSDWLVNRLRRGTSSAVLGAKLTTALINVTGVTQSIERIGAKWYYEGLRHLFNDPDGRTRAEVMAWIYESSGFMRDRADNVTRETAEAAKSLTGEEGSRLEAFNYWLYGRTQIMVDAPTWLGAYYKGLDAGNDHARSVDLADAAVREAQGSGDLVDLAAIQRGSAWRKLSTVFYHYASTTLARHSGAWKRLQVSDPSTYARFLADETLLFFLPVVLSGALGATFGALRGDDDDDDYGLTERMAAGGLSQILGLAPLLREMAGIAYGQFNYKGRPSDRVFTAIGQAAKEAYDATTEEGEFDFVRALTGANMAAGIWVGYPADQINKTIEGLAAILDGEAGATAILLGAPRR